MRVRRVDQLVVVSRGQAMKGMRHLQYPIEQRPPHPRDARAHPPIRPLNSSNWDAAQAVMVHFLNTKMHLRKSLQCLKRQRRGFLRQLCLGWRIIDDNPSCSQKRAGAIDDAPIVSRLLQPASRRASAVWRINLRSAASGFRAPSAASQPPRPCPDGRTRPADRRRSSATRFFPAPTP
jgi:hypothetical protein